MSEGMVLIEEKYRASMARALLICSSKSREAAAHEYVQVIREQERYDVALINQAIVKRWSHSGLDYIKVLAWKEVRSE